MKPERITRDQLIEGLMKFTEKLLKEDQNTNSEFIDVKNQIPHLSTQELLSLTK